MDQRFARYAPILLFMAILMTPGCERGATPPTAPAATNALQNAVTAEPALVKPEFLPSAGCFTAPVFFVHIWIRLHGTTGLFVRGLRFHYIDDFGTRVLPEVMPIPSVGSTPSSMPTASPVPVPGIAALPSPFPPAGTVPFFVRFGCGVFPKGTLFINADHQGGVSSMRIRIAGD